uniref:Uncharacterized protein n=1 Tax=Globisporangium ultimum (strain ATCC 200006 / CBS 805.95 / DAOM BR144) TaxID=431595 RepID=K3X4X7_GLOUD
MKKLVALFRIKSLGDARYILDLEITYKRFERKLILRQSHSVKAMHLLFETPA